MPNGGNKKRTCENEKWNNIGELVKKNCLFKYSHFQKFKTKHDFQAFLCYDIKLFNFMFLIHHPIWVEEEYERKKKKKKTDVLESMWEKKTKQKTFRCRHFSNGVVLCFWENKLI